ncbi:MAG: helix-turn-helix transcriptional regulator [Jatrophihabitans sp.]
MTEAGSRSGRLLSIVLVLQSRRTATARELATQLGVSMRSIYRDVSVLSEIGVPVYAETGRAGGYRLVDGYRTTLTGLTSQESLALFLIGMPAPAALLGLREQSRSAEAKLLAALGPGAREQANRMRDRFLLDLPAWYQNAEAPAILPELADAVLNTRRAQLQYRRWREPREVRRLLDPHGLVVKNGTWYLVAADRSRSSAPMRIYRASNILELTVLDEQFDRIEDFDLPTFWRAQLVDFDRRRFSGTALIKVSAGLIGRLPDLSDSSLDMAVAGGLIDEAGSCLARLPIESPTKAASHLIRYGADVEVIEPPELREELAALADAVLRQYVREPQQRLPGFHC